MALTTTSNSLRALNFTEKVHSGCSSRAPNYNPLSSGSTSAVFGERTEFSGVLNSVRGPVGKDGIPQRMWPLLEGRRRRCNVRLNAGSSPESQTADTEVESSTSQGAFNRSFSLPSTPLMCIVCCMSSSGSLSWLCFWGFHGHQEVFYGYTGSSIRMHGLNCNRYVGYLVVLVGAFSNFVHLTALNHLRNLNRKKEPS